MTELFSPGPIDFKKISLHEVTRCYGAEGLYQQFLQYIDCLDIDDDSRSRLYTAATLAVDIHAGQTRGEHPYVTHSLRVASRIVDHFGVSDPAIIAAALLHDSVEDMPGRLVLGSFISMKEAEDVRYQAPALEAIGVTFGSETEGLVRAVTNPPFDRSRDMHEQYRDHVIAMMRDDPKARIVKMSDFLDNCMGLNHNEQSPGRITRLAEKYYPLIPIMERYVWDLSTPLPDLGRQYIHDGLQRARVRCEDYIAP